MVFGWKMNRLHHLVQERPVPCLPWCSHKPPRFWLVYQRKVNFITLAPPVVSRHFFETARLGGGELPQRRQGRGNGDRPTTRDKKSITSALEMAKRKGPSTSRPRPERRQPKKGARRGPPRVEVSRPRATSFDARSLRSKGSARRFRSNTASWRTESAIWRTKSAGLRSKNAIWRSSCNR